MDKTDLDWKIIRIVEDAQERMFDKLDNLAWNEQLNSAEMLEAFKRNQDWFGDASDVVDAYQEWMVGYR